MNATSSAGSAELGSEVPLFSILSPVYNEERHIAEMIESVTRQSVDAWEIVFVDDGSTDGTLAIIRDYAARDSRIRLAHAGHRIGKTAAMNAAYRASRGRLLFLLSGDDTLPENGLNVRFAPFAPHADRAYQGSVAFFKMRSTSTTRKYDGLELPRGHAASRTGSSPTYSRDLADLIFPIPEELPSEDLWIGFLAEHLAARVDIVEAVAWNYRIHSGNSNPRHKDFPTMSQAIAKRAEVWRRLQEETRFDLSTDSLQAIRTRWELELLRRKGAVWKILWYRDSPMIDRLATAAAARSHLFALRMRFYRSFTGLRGA